MTRELEWAHTEPAMASQAWVATGRVWNWFVYEKLTVPALACLIPKQDRIRDRLHVLATTQVTEDEETLFMEKGRRWVWVASVASVRIGQALAQDCETQT